MKITSLIDKYRYVLYMRVILAVVCIGTFVFFVIEGKSESLCLIVLWCIMVFGSLFDFFQKQLLNCQIKKEYGSIECFREYYRKNKIYYWPKTKYFNIFGYDPFTWSFIFKKNLAFSKELFYIKRRMIIYPLLSITELIIWLNVCFAILFKILFFRMI